MEGDTAVRGLIVGIHVLAGFTGLLLGPVAMRAPKRRGRHVDAGRAYQVATAVLAVSALGLVAYDVAGLWWLGLIAIATEAAALGGWWVRRARVRGWLPIHVNLMCSSYISFVTAFLVVNWPSMWAWVLPTVVGSPLIGRATARVVRSPVPVG